MRTWVNNVCRSAVSVAIVLALLSASLNLPSTASGGDVPPGNVQGPAEDAETVVLASAESATPEEPSLPPAALELPPTEHATPNLAHSLHLDGSGDYVRIPHHQSLNLGTPYLAIEAWVRRAGGSNPGRVARRRGAARRRDRLTYREGVKEWNSFSSCWP